MRTIITLAITITLFNCRSKPDILPNYPNKSSAIVFELGVPKLFFGDAGAEKVWLVKLEKGKNKISELKLLETNFRSRSRLYYLNIEPGEYAFVGAHIYQKGNQNQPEANFYHVFDRINLEKSKFTVKPNQILVLGKYRIEFNGTPLEQDPDMDNVGESIVGNFKTGIGIKIAAAVATALLGGGSPDSSGYSGFTEIVQTPEMKAEIEKESKLDLEGTEWFVIPIAK
ncbi:hypothetical protein EHQ68_11555 [Leptospira congkakensis]|uniref:Uncharacterized protein n=1 Tax=Leptospira congkakensis TaxID=2484932 RepID=A0A4Z1AB80_9LEPT|nr:hypothetical protein [Leptospira congkakensis]TGL87186.1 hypothetical protein EHQ68_11555 [Leptospira congkakensis]TGL96754.1 hypothetical protein EHQ69_00500 [Leptospira congkakensis]TGL97603.1 hypothetical protein EHQ70_06155 [Leptospira congkakensis]